MTKAVVPYKKGSIIEVAGGLRADPHRVALALRNADVMVVCDVSGSMAAEDAGPSENQRRKDAEQEALDVLMENFPGKIAVGGFNSISHGLIHTGVLPEPDGGTPLFEALSFFYPKAISLKHKMVLISDGEPDPGDQPRCIALVEDRKYPIYGIYVGNPADPANGRQFLRSLSEASGGQFDFVNLKNMHLLVQKIAGYLRASNG